MSVRNSAITVLILGALCACSPAKAPDAAKPDAAPEAASPSPAPEAAAPEVDAEAQKILASLPAPYSGADLVNGKRQFAKCRSCHSLEEGGANMTGPNLHGVFGRKAGSKEGYTYSDAVKAAGFTWDVAQLDRWLNDPKADMPGTKMAFVGIQSDTDRRDVIAYVAVKSGYQPK